MALAISKKRKEDLVQQYLGMLERSTGVVLAGFSGVTVKDLEGLRQKIREAGGEFHVVKNSLMELAFKQAGYPLQGADLVGTTAVGFAGEDITAVAKAIVELAKQSEALHVKAGVIEGKAYTGAQVEQFADLPPLNVLQARLLSVLQGPAGRMAGVLAGSVRQMVTVVKAYSEKAAAPA
jgi:large subunit ribosomal protein L10